MKSSINLWDRRNQLADFFGLGLELEEVNLERTDVARVFTLDLPAQFSAALKRDINNDAFLGVPAMLDKKGRLQLRTASDFGPTMNWLRNWVNLSP